jgi:formylglycine-generating enzyme required for sulfatase activity
MVCVNGECIPPCDPNYCPGGCCNGVVCEPGTSNELCGNNGWPCVACGEGNLCIQQTCVTGVTWISAPGGTVYMGCIPGDTNCASDENPRHVVTIAAFEITDTSITQGQFQSVSGQNPSTFASCGANCPVETVSWTEANSFCQAVGGRLPTEAEWEYAARAWTNDIYYEGCDISACLGGLAWYTANSGGKTQPVCGKTPNAWSLCDVLGDVNQWVNDWYSSTYYLSSPQDNPPGPASGTYRVVRGGSYSDAATALRTSARGWLTPDSALSQVGFRCARDSAVDDDDDNDDDNDTTELIRTDPIMGYTWQVN